MKFLEIWRFEMVYQLRRPAIWIYFLTLCGLLLLVINEIADYADTVEVLILNSPLMYAELTAYANKFGFFLTAVLIGDSAFRDIQQRMDPLIFSSSVNKAAWFGGRFAGASSIAFVLTGLAVPLSLLISRFLLGVDPAIFGDLKVGSILASLFFLTIPNVLIGGLIMYSLVLICRGSLMAFAAAIILLVLSTFTLELAEGNRALAYLLDPTGLLVVSSIGDAMTSIQKANALFQLSTSLTTNRIVWLIFSLAIGFIGFRGFKMEHYAGQALFKHIKKHVTEPRSLPVITPGPLHFQFRPVSRITQVLLLASRFFQEFLFSPTVLFLPLIGVYAFILIPNMSQGPMGVPILLTADRILLFMNNAALEIFIALFVSMMAGQLVWRERDSRLSEIADAAPASDMLLILSKYLAMAAMLGLLALTLVIAGIAIQNFSGYTGSDTALLFQMIFSAQLPDILMLAGVALAIHVLINQKYVSHLAVMCFYLYTVIAPRYFTDHKLFSFGSDTGLANSIFYDQTPFLIPWILFKSYWSGWALLAVLIASAFWVRGRDTGVRLRLRKAFAVLRSSILLPIALTIISITGAIIYFNIYILNDYESAGERDGDKAAYESRYRAYKDLPQPHLAATILNVELYPRQQSAEIKGSFELKNSTGTQIPTIHIDGSTIANTTDLTFDRAGRLTLSDLKLRHWIYTLEKPLEAGDSLKFDFTVRINARGFTNKGVQTEVMSNGTWFSNAEILPGIGYREQRELSDEGARRDNGLPKHTEYPTYRNKKALMMRSGLSKMRFQATIGTEADQSALAPGRRTTTWLQRGRRYFHFQAEEPIRPMYHIYSARYAVEKFEWRNIDLQIYHHPKNASNIGAIKKSMIASLKYYTSNFSPYPYHDLRFVEYPDAGTGGISLAGSIGYNPNFGMLNSAREPRGFDLAFAVAAHEIAHQWWPHQLMAAPVTGRALMTESLAWYSAFNVIEKTFGSKHLTALLNAMRADYLDPRARAGVPLLEATESFQGYRKGPFAMYALREYIGEKSVNTALRNLLYKFGSDEPPYATSLDLYQELRNITPDSLHYLLKDLFETNAFWELKAKKASVKRVSNGDWEVLIEIAAKKVVVDKEGAETETKMNDWIEVGVFSEKSPKVLYLQRHLIRSGLNKIIVRVKARPDEAGIDPRKLLVDMEGDDNVIKVTAK